jgi:ABC transporter, permease protein
MKNTAKHAGVAHARVSRIKRGGINGLTAQIILIATLSVIVLLTLMPVLITLGLSLKTERDISIGSLWSLPTTIQWENYSFAFQAVLPNMGITLFIDIVSVLAMTMISSFTAYIFVRKRFPGRNLLFYLVILPMLVPGVVSLTPQYLNIIEMNLLGSWWAVILPYVAGNQIASVFLFRTFMAQQPADLYEAAEIDGAGDFRMYLSISLPLAFGIIMVQAVSIFSAIYNDYLWPLMIFMHNPEHGTLMPVLKDLATQASQMILPGTENIMAGRGATYALYLVSGVPLVISTIVGLKFFIDGEFASGMKL